MIESIVVRNVHKKKYYNINARNTIYINYSDIIIFNINNNFYTNITILIYPINKIYKTNLNYFMFDTLLIPLSKSKYTNTKMIIKFYINNKLFNINIINFRIINRYNY
ncbi:hypothetical protein CHBEV_281 [Choristoneura biennis entomopoxvirus]|uniref:Uncharacterized protein n=1 Tax=Choristoneura biennis entomopoxvirus TaxID=10288 RepID=A0A916KPU3_CBEPV|nr:hypothetical protein CHBEV_281 [Choristoneura biennis entomopoxvirus]CCU55849.1 hypothetical protein CHBEV_281 [Choristoneura biennis entomopoxvirus]